MSRTQISAFLGLSVAFWIVMLWWRNVPLSMEMLGPFGAVVGAVSAVLLIFEKWAWHWPIFRGWLVQRPFVAGTWTVELKSDWINPETGQGVPPINCFMAVRQTWSTLSLRLLTAESRSETVSAGIECCRDGTFEISCAYRNKPRSEYRHKSEVHYGAMLLVADGAKPNRLEGDYWTDRKTTGSLVLTGRRSGVWTTYEEAAQQA